MKNLSLFSIFILLCGLGVFAQSPRVPIKVTPRNVPFKTVTEISDAEWARLAAALKNEDWKLSETIAAQFLQTLKNENEKKQLAQLRYIELYALAGQVLAANSRGDALLESEKLRAEIDRLMATFINKEVVMPSRLFTTDCGKKLNVVCQVKDTPNALRTTATNQEGNAIHSFDYVQFDENVKLGDFDGKNTFLGGILRRAEYNEDKSKPWVMRLFFNKGFLRVVL